MAKRRIFWVMLVMVLAFGVTVVGCEGEKEDVTITFDANGGKWDDGSTTKSVKVAYDSDHTKESLRNLVPDPNKQGSSFKGWENVANPDPNTFYSIGTFNRDRTFYAIWTTQ